MLSSTKWVIYTNTKQNQSCRQVLRQKGDSLGLITNLLFAEQGNNNNSTTCSKADRATATRIASQMEAISSPSLQQLGPREGDSGFCGVAISPRRNDNLFSYLHATETWKTTLAFRGFLTASVTPFHMCDRYADLLCQPPGWTFHLHNFMYIIYIVACAQTQIEWSETG